MWIDGRKVVVAVGSSVMIHISDLNDPRLDPYRNLRDLEIAQQGRFITEGKRVTVRLLESGITAESVLTDERRAAEMEAAVRGRAPLYVISEELMKGIAGFKIHTGVLGIGLRPRPLTLEAMMGPAARPYTLFIVPIVKELANLGALVRTAAAFGATGMVLGPYCCDPFYRRCVRVSMASVLRLPIVRSDDLGRDMRRLRREWNVELLATVLAEDAEVLRDARRSPGRDGIGIVLGHEVEGLDAATIAMCDRRITIPMHLGTDSLNVSVSAAIFCYHFMEPAAPIRLPEASDRQA